MRRQASKSTAKRATNVSVRSDLLAAARDAGLNLSATLERALIAELAEALRNKWQRDNREGIAAYNEHVEKHGTFANRVRGF
jgi:antitoxin CcdA